MFLYLFTITKKKQQPHLTRDRSKMIVYVYYNWRIYFNWIYYWVKNTQKENKNLQKHTIYDLEKKMMMEYAINNASKHLFCIQRANTASIAEL